MTGIWAPKTFLPETVQQAIAAIKESDAAIWDSWVALESQEKVSKDIIHAVDGILFRTFKDFSGADLVKLRFQIRQAARIGAGWPI